MLEKNGLPSSHWGRSPHGSVDCKVQTLVKEQKSVEYLSIKNILIIFSSPINTCMYTHTN